MTITVQHLIDSINTRQRVVNDNTLSSGDLNYIINNVSELATADSHCLSFIEQDKYLQDLQTTSAGVVLIKQANIEYLPKGVIALVVSSPYLAYACCSQLFDKPVTATIIHPTAIIDPTATIGNNVSIGAYSVIGADSVIGDNSVIASHVQIDNKVTIGANAVIKSHVSIAEECQLGNNVRIHSGAVIGSEGFGFAPTTNPAKDGWQRIAQLGRVIIGDNVRIGANTTIDRGAINDTIIGDNVILDNLIQVAHNVQIGNGTAIAAKTGIAGSAIIGQNCIIGGAVGIAGHLRICDNVTITAMSFISKSIDKQGSYSSAIPAVPSAKWRRTVAKIRQLIKK